MLPQLIESLPAWTRDIPFRPDELLSSWLCRSAHAHGFPPYRFLSWRFEGVPLLDRDIDLTGDGHLFDRLDRSARLADGGAAAASLAPYASVLGSTRDGSGAGAYVPFVLSAGVYHRTRRRHGLQACRDCLCRLDPWLSRWGRLAFVALCPDHGRPLMDGCPHCDAPLVPHRALIGELGSCHTCRRSLVIPSPASLHPRDEVIRDVAWLQSVCLAALAAPDRMVPATPFTGRSFLSTARTVVAVCSATDQRSQSDVGGRRQLELLRVPARLPLLARVAAWLQDWPHGFRALAAEHGLTRRTFVRRAVPDELAVEVGILPPGGTRVRAGWRSIFEDGTLRDLRRADVGLYRAERAGRLLVAAAG